MNISRVLEEQSLARIRLRHGSSILFSHLTRMLLVLEVQSQRLQNSAFWFLLRATRRRQHRPLRTCHCYATARGDARWPRYAACFSLATCAFVRLETRESRKKISEFYHILSLSYKQIITTLRRTQGVLGFWGEAVGVTACAATDD